MRIALTLVGLAGPWNTLQAQTWNGFSGNWSDPNMWSGGVVPASSTSLSLTFGGTGTTTYTATNDISSTFLMNSLTLTSDASVTNTIAGSSLRFAGTTPQLLLNNSGAMLISNTMSSIADLVIGGTGTGTTTFSGTFTANNLLTFNSSAALTFSNNLNVRRALNVGGTGTFSTAFLDGFGLVTKSGTSTMFVSGSSGGSQTFLGGFLITEGQVQTNNFGRSAFRINPIQLSGSGTLAYSGSLSTTFMPVGEISGTGGAVNTALGTATNVGLIINPLTAASTAATMTTTGSSGVFVRGIAGQTFTGDLSGLRGGLTATSYRSAIGVYAGQARIQGNAAFTFGGTSASLTANNGAIVIDNSDTNITDRIGDTTTFHLRNGGALIYIGNAAGGTEVIGTFSTSTANAGGGLIAIQQNSTTVGTVLQFANSGNFSLRPATTYSLLFTGTNFGTSGAAPRVTFVGTPYTSMGGLLSNDPSATSRTIGWAVINNQRWAGYNATNGVVPLLFGNTDTARTAANVSGVAAEEVAWFAPAAAETNTVLGTTIAPAALRIDAAVSGQSLSLGANFITTTGLLYTGNTDFTITATTGGVASGVTTRYVWVTDAAGTLKYDFSLATSNAPLNKTGDGWLEIVGSTNRFAFTSATSISVLQGVLRSSLVALGGTNPAGSDGPNTTINLYGGTLEISGGGSLLRALGTAGVPAPTSAGGVLQMQGQVGFSAVGGDLTVTLTTAVGGTTAAALTWNSGGFVADGFALVFGTARATSVVDFTNAINLNDSGSVTTYQPREIRVLDNLSSSGDYARLSGLLSGSSHADLLKTGPGTLELSGAAANTYSGGTLITEGTLLISKSGGLGSTGYILLGNRGSSASASLLFNAVTPGTVLAPNVYVPADNTGTVTIGTIMSSGEYQLGGVFDLRKNVVARTDFASTFNLSAVVIGSGGMTKTGVGTMVLTGANSFTGGLVINEGTVRAATSSASLGVGGSGGNSTVTLNAGTLELLSTAGISFTANVVVAGNSSIVASRTATGTTSPSLGTLSIGSQTLTFGLGTNATAATINLGTVSLTGDATFNVGDNMTVILNSGTVIGGISDGGATRVLTKNGNGRLSLFADNTGGITGTNTSWQLNAGVIQASQVSRFGNSSVDLFFNGGTWNLTDVSASPGSGRAFVFQAGGGTIDINSDAGISIVNSSQFSGSGAFTKAGLGPMSITAGQSGLVGPIFINGGSLQIGSASALGIPSSSTAITLSGGTLGVINNTISLPNTRPIVIAASAGSSIDVATGLTLTVPAGFSGVGPFNKTGDGRLVLSAASAGSYSGAATVQAGTLALNQTLNLTGGGGIAVAAGGTLQGSGTITGSAAESVTVNGVISPGNSVGTLTVSGAANIWNAGSSVFFEFKTPGTSDAAAGVDWDYLNLTGSTLSLTGPITLRIDALQADGITHATLSSQNPFDPVAGNYHMLFVRTAGVTGFTAGTFQIQDSVANFGVFGTGNAFTPAAGQFWVSLEGNDLYINYSAVPEPSSLLMLGVACCGWIAHRRRRRKLAASEQGALPAAFA